MQAVVVLSHPLLTKRNWWFTLHFGNKDSYMKHWSVLINIGYWLTLCQPNRLSSTAHVLITLCEHPILPDCTQVQILKYYRCTYWAFPGQHQFLFFFKIGAFVYNFDWCQKIDSNLWLSGFCWCIHQHHISASHVGFFPYTTAFKQQTLRRAEGVLI